MKLTRKTEGILFILPAFIFLVTIYIYPLSYSLKLSFFKKSLATQESYFVGLENYKIIIFADDLFWTTVKNTIVFTVGSVIGQIAIGLGLALLLNQKIKGRDFFRGLWLFPWVLPPAMVALLWIWLYHPQLGIFNDILIKLRILTEPIQMLGDPTLAMVGAIITNLWRGFPLSMVMFLASLQAIPVELYEASIIDGASAVQKFRYITFPLIKYTFLLLILLITIWTFGFFDLIWVLTRGGPFDATEVLPTYVYRMTFMYLKFGYGSALSWFIVIFIGLFSFLYVSIWRKISGEI